MWYSTVAILLALGSSVSAVTQRCGGSDVCFSLSIPDATVSSGNGDVFFQLSAPTSMSWVALGQGESMIGANIFVMYTSASGTGVTVSPRLAGGYQEPQYNADAQIELLEGSGVSDGIMTANVKCSNCQSWSSGSMDFTASSGNWIFASQPGDPIDSDDTEATISQHTDRGSFEFDFTEARGGDSVNPFAEVSSGTSSGDSSGGSQTVRCTPKSTANSASATAASSTRSASNTIPTSADGTRGGPGSFPSTYGQASFNSAFEYGPLAPRQASVEDNGCEEGFEPVQSSDGSLSGTPILSSSSGLERTRRILIAHGVLASLAFVILFPAGAISIRLLSFPGLVWFHAAVQVLAFVTFIAAFGLGAYLANELALWSHHHAIIGATLFVLLFFQPIFGYVHHLAFKKHGTRTLWSHIHIWLGRAIIIAGMINGGFGLNLANNTTGGKIVYGVVAGAVGLVYLAAIVLGERKRAASRSPGLEKGSGNGSPTVG